MTGDGLSLRMTAPDEDGAVALTADARAGAFSGQATAWVAVVTVRDFARALEAYPLGDAAASGLVARYIRGGVEEVLIGISVHQIDSLGHLAARVQLGELIGENARRQGNSVKLELRTTYFDLGRFAADLLRLAGGQGEEAFLRAESTG